MSKANGSASGVGICTVLGIVFIVLKLTGNIDWSWVWVLSPFWIPLALALCIIFLALVIVGVAMLFGEEE